MGHRLLLRSGRCRRLLICLAAGIAGAAPAQAQRDPCSGQDLTACFKAEPRDFLDIFGLPSAEARRTAGDQVRRVMVFGRNVRPLVAIEFRRAAGEEPAVSLYLPRRDVDPLPEPALTATVPLAEWDALGEAARHFDRVMAPLPREPLIDGTFTVCGDGGVDIVETVDLRHERRRGQLRQRAEHTCDDGLANAYARRLAETAVRVIPACGTLDDRQGHARLLADCAMLQGDRMAAAAAHNGLWNLRFPDRPDRVRYLFSQEARLDWQGRPASGAEAAGDAWTAGTRGGERANLFLLRLVGEHADRVRVTGGLEKWTQQGEEASILWFAPVELVLARGLDARFQIVEGRVGAFVRVPARCQPGRLDHQGC